jgi:hypothetical protein
MRQQVTGTILLRGAGQIVLDSRLSARSLIGLRTELFLFLLHLPIGRKRAVRILDRKSTNKE